jgi:hypothetical protein
MRMLKAAAFSCVAIIGVAHADCLKGNAGIPPGANTTDASAPFYIDISGLDFKTSPPTRDPKNPNYPAATELPDGTLPPIKAEGNFIIGPTHAAAPELTAQDGAPAGKTYSFTMSSADSTVFNPGMIRDDPDSCLNASIFTAQTAPGDKSNILVPTAHAGIWTRSVHVYVPADYVAGSQAPFIVLGDSGYPDEKQFFTVLDNLIREHRIPPVVAISIGNGGQDAQGSERGFEYDAVNGAYAEFVENEVLPLAERRANIKLTKNPEGRATMGISSSGSAAFTMAWFHPELYHRVLTYSPTMVNQQWPHNPALPGGAWEYHSAWAGLPAAKSDARSGSPLIPNSPTKPIRIWFETGDHDNFYPATPIADGMHDWTLADERFAKVLADKGYHYQFLFARNAEHVDKATVAQTLPTALEWLWQGYPVQ